MLAKAVTLYLAALFICGIIATLMPAYERTKGTQRTHQTALRVEPFQNNVKTRIDRAILRDYLAAPEDRENDGIENDVRDQMKYRPLSSPMT